MAHFRDLKPFSVSFLFRTFIANISISNYQLKTIKPCGWDELEYYTNVTAFGTMLIDCNWNLIDLTGQSSDLNGLQTTLCWLKIILLVFHFKWDRN